ncbi:hypothetical protein AAFF_G00095760 [Aldrovandia affinis]|uniref:Uncharacterized protein n=1 Tax=Aldrovandia affinis TaxID=143900 RepID=A0AAD7RVQ3_9TELE|nr:hypothetical protein AAFF_G00095760 [Aldrovandia affinis]
MQVQFFMGTSAVFFQSPQPRAPALWSHVQLSNCQSTQPPCTAHSAEGSLPFWLPPLWLLEVETTGVGMTSMGGGCKTKTRALQLSPQQLLAFSFSRGFCSAPSTQPVSVFPCQREVVRGPEGPYICLHLTRLGGVTQPRCSIHKPGHNETPDLGLLTNHGQGLALQARACKSSTVFSTAVMLWTQSGILSVLGTQCVG